MEQYFITAIWIIVGIPSLYFVTKGLAILTCKIADELDDIKMETPINEYSYGNLRGKPRIIETGTNRLYVEVYGKKHYVEK